MHVQLGVNLVSQLTLAPHAPRNVRCTRATASMVKPFLIATAVIPAASTYDGASSDRLIRKRHFPDSPVLPSNATPNLPPRESATMICMPRLRTRMSTFLTDFHRQCCNRVFTAASGIIAPSIRIATSVRTQNAPSSSFRQHTKTRGATLGVSRLMEFANRCS